MAWHADAGVPSERRQAGQGPDRRHHVGVGLIGLRRAFVTAICGIEQSGSVGPAAPRPCKKASASCVLHCEIISTGRFAATRPQRKTAWPRPRSPSAARTTARGRCAAGCCARWPGSTSRRSWSRATIPSTRAELLLLSPSFLVPCLTHDGIKVWDTLAIAEYLNEVKPGGRAAADGPRRARPLPRDLRRDAFGLQQSALGAADEPQGALSRLQGLGRRAGRHRPHHRHLARMPRAPTAARTCSARRPAWPTRCTRRCARASSPTTSSSTQFHADRRLARRRDRISGRAARRQPVLAVRDPDAVPDLRAGRARPEHPDRLRGPAVARHRGVHGRRRVHGVQLRAARCRGMPILALVRAGRSCAPRSSASCSACRSLRIKGFYLAVATLACQFFVLWALQRIGWFTNHSTSGVITAQKMVILGYAFDTPVREIPAHAARRRRAGAARQEHAAQRNRAHVHGGARHGSRGAR